MAKDYSKKGGKWQTSMQGASQSYIDGINGTDVNPMALAAAKVDTAIARYTERLRSGTWAASLNSINPQTWKNVCTTIGAGRLTDGATKGKPKVDNFFAKAGPAYNNIRSTIRAMPNATKADRRARMIKNADMMEAMKGITHR